VISRGDIWRYPYLWQWQWQWQMQNGETEGRKPRGTACVVSSKNAVGVHELILIAITSKPRPDMLSVEIPELECRRANLDTHIPLWAVVSEYNYDIAERSFYLDPNGKVGSFSSSFMQELTTRLVDNIKAKQARKVSRNP
jgi:hypothetical protein